jgi:hypothetical protein
MCAPHHADAGTTLLLRGHERSSRRETRVTTWGRAPPNESCPDPLAPDDRAGRTGDSRRCSCPRTACTRRLRLLHKWRRQLGAAPMWESGQTWGTRERRHRSLWGWDLRLQPAPGRDMLPSRRGRAVPSVRRPACAQTSRSAAPLRDKPDPQTDGAVRTGSVRYPRSGRAGLPVIRVVARRLSRRLGHIGAFLCLPVVLSARAVINVAGCIDPHLIRSATFRRRGGCLPRRCGWGGRLRWRLCLGDTHGCTQ